MPFPLQRLPDPALKHIFRCMTPLELIAISVLSTELSGLAKSMKIRADRLDIELEENVTIDGDFQNGRLVFSFPSAGPDVLDEKPKNIEIFDRCDNNDLVWTDPGVTLRTYLERISRNFECGNGIKIYFRTEHEVINMETLSKCVVPVTDTVIDHPCSAEYAQKILKFFGPLTKNVDIYDDLFRQHSSSFVQLIVISNYDEFWVSDISHATLDNLLTFNAESIIIRESSFAQVDVNRFIKLWMNGCIPRLKRLGIRHCMVDEIYNRNIVLRGIKYKEVRDVVKRTFGEEVIKGGCDIRSRNGRRATVLFNVYKFINEFNIVFYVWD